MAKFNEKEWRARADADIIASYQEIMGDSRRRNAAYRQAQKEANELSKRAEAMRAVSKKKK